MKLPPRRFEVRVRVDADAPGAVCGDPTACALAAALKPFSLQASVMPDPNAGHVQAKFRHGNTWVEYYASLSEHVSHKLLDWDDGKTFKPFYLTLQFYREDD